MINKYTLYLVGILLLLSAVFAWHNHAVSSAVEVAVTAERTRIQTLSDAEALKSAERISQIDKEYYDKLKGVEATSNYWKRRVAERVSIVSNNRESAIEHPRVDDGSTAVNSTNTGMDVSESAVIELSTAAMKMKTQLEGLQEVVKSTEVVKVDSK